MVVWDEINIEESSINQKSAYTILVILCTGATFIKKSYVVARIVSFNPGGTELHYNWDSVAIR